jgi:hypothetical protein
MELTGAVRTIWIWTDAYRRWLFRSETGSGTVTGSDRVVRSSSWGGHCSWWLPGSLGLLERLRAAQVSV